MTTQLILSVISTLCIKNMQIIDREQKITCIEYYTNCIINTEGRVKECKQKEPKWTK